MIYWYQFFMVYLVTGIILVSENRVYRIIPPKTTVGWGVLILNVILLVTMWWFILDPPSIVEWSAGQADQYLYSILPEFILTQFIFSRFLPTD